MTESSTNTTTQFSASTSLAAWGLKLQQLDLFGPIRKTVKIAQKTVKDTPVDKLYDAFIATLAGAQSLAEINTRLRADPGLQAAFGRDRCAEQSVGQQTFNACSTEHVKQLEQGLDTVSRQHSQGYQHDYQADWQGLDVDMSGLPCGPKAVCATKGYFAQQRNRRGRQLGRVLASRYEEIVVDRLFEGTTQLNTALQPLLQAAEITLQLDQAKRERTVVRLDAGGGSLQDGNWLLERGYQVHCKDYSGVRAQRLAHSVEHGVEDPLVQGRPAGWVTVPATEYVRPVRRIAVRCRKAHGQWAVAVLISTLSAATVLQLTKQALCRQSAPVTVLRAYVYFYDQRGGGIETSFKGDKPGVGLGKRAKKHFEAQQMVMLLSTLAHNVIVWARRWLAAPKLQPYGIMRMVRDVFHVSGFLVFNAMGQLIQISLNRAAPLAPVLVDALQELLASAHIAINLAQT